MFHPLSYQLYKSEHEYRYEHRLSAARKRAADAMTASVRVLSSVR